MRGGATRSRVEFLDDRFLQQVVQAEARRRRVPADARGRGAGGRARARALRRASTPRSTTAASRSACIRPFLEGGEQKPYFLAMTAAGQSALNVQGLDTVVIDDTRFTNVVERGQERAHASCTSAPTRSCRWRGACTAASRAGACSSSAIATSTSARCKPDGARVPARRRLRARRASPCADLGVRADELELPVPLDRIAYRARDRSSSRRAASSRTGGSRATARLVEAMPVERAWAELLVQRRRRAGAVPRGDERRRVAAPHDARGARPRRARSCRAATTSPRTTSTPRRSRGAGYIGEVYGLPRHLFDEEDDRASGPSGAACS